MLISPWLDVTMSYPDQAPIERVDPMLARAGLAEAGRLYAGALDPSDPRVSPAQRGPTRAGAMTVFSGTHDILNTDARRLVEKAKAAIVAIDYHEGEGLPHVYPLLPTPEGRAAREGNMITVGRYTRSPTYKRRSREDV